MARKKTSRASAKNLQVRLGPQAHDIVMRLADIRGKSIAETVRDAVEVLAICVSYAQAKRELFWQDPKTGDKTYVLIPGLNSSTTLVVPESGTEH